MSFQGISNTVQNKVGNSQQNKPTVKDPNHRIKQMLWVYFLLIIFEGALRKWILPFLSSPLLIVRDPIALYLIVLANQRGMIYSGYAKSMIVVGIISLFTAMAFGHGNLGVALYGARILVLHFPVIFIMGKYFNFDDVIKVGKVTMWIAIPMIVLVTMQFYSPQSAFVNRGVGGDESGAGFSGAMGYLRPPGTFSFTNGNSLFFSFVAVFVFYFWLSGLKINKLSLIGATVALMASIPLSISRTLLFTTIVSGIFTLIAVSRKPKYFSKVLGAAIGIIALFMIVSQLDMFKTASGAFMARFEGANESEGGVESVLVDRYLGGLLTALKSAANQPFFGYGIGLGSGLGAQIFGIPRPEGEWATITWEMGVIFGFVVIIVRMGFSLEMLIAGYKLLVKGNILPWILLSFLLLNVPQAQWKQPTSLGFGILIGGLQLASMRQPKRMKQRIGLKHTAPPQAL
jgi:hypothetical protein